MYIPIQNLNFTVCMLRGVFIQGVLQTFNPGIKSAAQTQKTNYQSTEYIKDINIYNHLGEAYPQRISFFYEDEV